MAEPFGRLFLLADHRGFHHQNIFKIYSLRRISEMPNGTSNLINGRIRFLARSSLPRDLAARQSGVRPRGAGARSVN
jgi:hypothetical protein